jgi:hypothetical protein
MSYNELRQFVDRHTSSPDEATERLLSLFSKIEESAGSKFYVENVTRGCVVIFAVFKKLQFDNRLDRLEKILLNPQELLVLENALPVCVEKTDLLRSIEEYVTPGPTAVKIDQQEFKNIFGGLAGRVLFAKDLAHYA